MIYKRNPVYLLNTLLWKTGKIEWFWGCALQTRSKAPPPGLFRYVSCNGAQMARGDTFVPAIHGSVHYLHAGTFFTCHIETKKPLQDNVRRERERKKRALESKSNKTAPSFAENTLEALQCNNETHSCLIELYKPATCWFCTVSCMFFGGGEMAMANLAISISIRVKAKAVSSSVETVQDIVQFKT